MSKKCVITSIGFTLRGLSVKLRRLPISITPFHSNKLTDTKFSPCKPSPMASASKRRTSTNIRFRRRTAKAAPNKQQMLSTAQSNLRTAVGSRCRSKATETASRKRVTLHKQKQCQLPPKSVSHLIKPKLKASKYSSKQQEQQQISPGLKRSNGKGQRESGESVKKLSRRRRENGPATEGKPVSRTPVKKQQPWLQGISSCGNKIPMVVLEDCGHSVRESSATKKREKSRKKRVRE